MTPPVLAYGTALATIEACSAGAAYAAIQRTAASLGIAPSALRPFIAAPGIVRVSAGAHTWVIRRLAAPPSPTPAKEQNA